MDGLWPARSLPPVIFNSFLPRQTLRRGRSTTGAMSIEEGKPGSPVASFRS